MAKVHSLYVIQQKKRLYSDNFVELMLLCIAYFEYFLLYFIGNKANNYLLYRSPLKSFHQFRKAGGNGGGGGNW